MQLVHALLLFGSSILWFLVAAKTHGRQIRLEREYRGIASVDFRREVTNHPWIEELWRKDRNAYWTRAVVVFLPIVLGLYVSDRVDLWAILPLSIIAAMSVAFTTQALVSQQHFRLLQRAPPDPIGPTPRHEDREWKTKAARGTAEWFTATFVCFFVALVAFMFVLMS